MTEGRNRKPARPPPLLGGLVIVLWGITTGQYVLGGILALLYESHRLIPVRWEISDDLFERIWRFCFIAFFVLAGIGFLRTGAAAAFELALKWTPVLLLPLALAQVYAEREAVPAAVFSLINKYVRKLGAPAGGLTREPLAINIEYFYLLAVLLSASAPNRPGPVFYSGAALLVLWAAWHNTRRPKSAPWLLAFAMLAVTAAGYYGHVGLHQLHLYLEREAFFLNYSPPSNNDPGGTTSIGSIGKIKLSPSIIWRVRPRQGPAPEYLRTGMYNMYAAGTWFVRGDLKHKNSLLMDPAGGAEWAAGEPPGRGTRGSIQVIGKSGRSETTLALPGSPLRLQGLAAESVTLTAMGNCVAQGAPHLLNFGVSYSSTPANDPAPAEDDLVVSEGDSEAVARTAEKLGLAALEPRAACAAVSRFFLDNFDYTTYLTVREGDGQDSASALSTFLEKERRGHCEFFATATVMLLRKAGIPARYTVGYAVSEYSRENNEYLVRGLHGHAWVTAWLDNSWEYIDNTPPGWSAAENRKKKFFQSVADAWNSMSIAFLMWRDTSAGQTAFSAVKWSALAILVIYLWVRLFKGQASRLARVAAPEEPGLDGINGTDSEYYDIERRLMAIGESRPRGLPLKTWWTSIAGRYPADTSGRIARAVDLHYRLRFTADGLTSEQRSELRRLTEECISRLNADSQQSGG